MQVKLTTELLQRKGANEALYLKIQDETVHTWQVTSPSPTKIQTRDNRQLEREFTGTCQLSLQSEQPCWWPPGHHSSGTLAGVGLLWDRLTGEAVGGHSICQTTHSVGSSFEGKTDQWKNYKT